MLDGLLYLSLNFLICKMKTILFTLQGAVTIKRGLVPRKGSANGAGNISRGCATCLLRPALLYFRLYYSASHILPVGVGALSAYWHRAHSSSSNLDTIYSVPFKIDCKLILGRAALLPIGFHLGFLKF